jgi:hypothetical protein
MSHRDIIARAVANIRISAGVRLAYVILRLAASIEESFGKAVIDILKKQYPDQEVDANAAQVGNKLMAIARKQLQHNETDAMDAIQDFLTYITTGTEYTEGEEGQREKRTEADPWNFAKDFKTWKEALGAIYSNLRRRSMSRSIKKFKRKDVEKSVDDAFGKRPEGGGSPEGGEAAIPDVDEGDVSKALDDRAAVKEFMDLMEDYIPLLESSLSEDTKKLFDLVFYDEIGGFGSDIKENMNQASALKEKYPDLFEANKKRWSGFVGDLRKKLLSEIETFIEKKLPKVDYETLYEAFFSDTTPREVEKKEEEKVKQREDYQRGVDERKIADWKWMEEKGVLPEKEKKSYENLLKKLEKKGVDVDAIEPKKPDSKKLKRLGISDEEAA